MSEEGKSFAGRAADCWSAMRANPDRSMHLTSIIAGVLLFIGGLSGLINLLNPLGMVLSVYNIIFAGLILTSELKALPVFKTLNKRVDLYFHILSVPRGKAGFYVFIGILAFLGTHDWSTSRTFWEPSPNPLGTS